MRNVLKVATQHILGIGYKELQQNRVEVGGRVLKWTGPGWGLVMRFI
jgi:hypothetical protein